MFGAKYTVNAQVHISVAFELLTYAGINDYRMKQKK